LQIRLEQDFIASTLDQGHCIFFGNHAIYLFGDKILDSLFQFNQQLRLNT
jgi:hypothetical protein